MSSHTASFTHSSTSAGDYDSDTEFVDYVPNPQVKVLPPAKYKLWLIIFVLVYFARWVGDEAKLREFLEFNGWLSFNASLFAMLGIVVFVMVYGAIDLFQTCLTFQTKNGKIYGVEAWLKQPRAQWMYRHENFFFEVMARVVHILEEGFSMFDAPPAPLVDQKESPQQFDCKDRSCQKTLKIEHRIKPEKLEDYNKWVVRIRSAAKQQNGVECTDEKESPRREWDVEKGVSDDDEETAKDAPFLVVVHIKFTNIDAMNDWMLSPRRKALMDQLEPMLAQPDVVQVAKHRTLPDAFSDLLTRQGTSAPKSPPKKWKVWWLTLLALYITVHWTGSFLPYYLDKWGVSDLDVRLHRIVDTLIVTYLNSYFTAPLFLFLFDHWLQRTDSVKNTRQPWVMFDKGFESIWLKVALSFAFYGGCLIAILVENR